MSVLSVRTREKRDVQGLSRVYFSCHPDDFKDYFDVICEDIFRTQNCAIYYESEWEVPAGERELEELLASMQLFVLPLTNRYLEEESRSINREYVFAMEQHIPVLPIAVEPGLESKFSARFNQIREGYGEIQILNRCSADDTEIPYEKKLADYLSHILAGDELARQIRAAFDAYIFLSYRKKDRAYAKELMNIIHRIPFCRKMAIWYDEYLVPGESWSQNIVNAIVKSALVVLAVTPSITEKENYVVEHEYPEALAQGKSVIPAEMLPVDPGMIRQLFPGMMDMIDCHDSEKFAEVLKGSLKQLVKEKSEDSPEHNFLIGLAYLSGIDMERDPDMALTLITDAADAGLLEAMDKLGVMYLKGQGVAVDYKEALKWFSRAAEKGYSWSMYHMGEMYYDGKGVSRSYDTARMLFSKAAGQGNQAAMYEIGLMDQERQNLYCQAREGDTEAAMLLKILFGKKS